MVDTSDTSYQIVRVGNAFAVQVLYPTGGTGMRRGFPTAADAEAWVREQAGHDIPPALEPLAW